MWKCGITERCENFFKLPTGFRQTQKGKYGDWDPTVYTYDREVLVYFDTEFAMTSGCKFYVDLCVGAILCSDANISRWAILKVTTKHGESLA